MLLYANNLHYAIDVGGSFALDAFPGGTLVNFPELAWNRDGTRLYAASHWGGRDYRVAVWNIDPAGGIQPRMATRHVRLEGVNSSVLMTEDAANGLLLASANGALLSLHDGAAPEMFRREDGRNCDEMTGPGARALRVSANGSAVDFFQCDEASGHVALFDLRRPGVTAGANAAALSPALLEAGPIKLAAHTLPFRQITLGGRVLALDAGEQAWSAAVAPDGSGFALGTSYGLRFEDASGRTRWTHPVPARAVNVTPDGRFVVADGQDGVIRWLRPATGQLVISLYVHPDRQRWVLWTPRGFYDASRDGDALIGWLVNAGGTRVPQFHDASRFVHEFFRPDVVAGALDSADEPEALRQADAELGVGRGISVLPPQIQQLLPPVVKVVSPAQGEAASGGEVTLRVALQSPQDAPILELLVRVNGRTLDLPAQRGLKLDVATMATRDIVLKLPPADATVQVFARNRNAMSAPSELRLAGRADTARAAPRSPRLFVLAVGVSRYAWPELNLGLAAKDATDFARVMRRQVGTGLYREVAVRELTDAHATRAEVAAGLAWLRAQVGVDDVGVVFLAGHGMTDAGNDYYFLDADTDIADLARTSTPDAAILDTLSHLAGRSVLFVDTCHAAGVAGGRRARLAQQQFMKHLEAPEINAVVLASSRRDQFAEERADWGNGAFTLALVEGLDGRADSLGTGHITFKGLDFYVSNRVRLLTDERQEPTTISPATGFSDFELARPVKP